MSYEKVKSISIKDNKVFINCASNNVYPLTYVNQECSYFTKILQEKGERELNIEILKEFESGNLQSGLSNKFTRALKVLYYILKEEYKPFNWRNEGYEKAKVLRESQAFKDLLLKALNTKLPKEKFIIFKSSYGGYVRKETKRHIFYGTIEQAKEYDFKEQAEQIAKQVNGEVRIK